MDDFLKFALLGIGVGAVYGLSAQGLVLVFLGNRVLNFAQGAIALVAAYVCFEATRAGVPAVPAALTGLVASIGVGALVELLVMRPLRSAASSTRLVATIGLLTVIQSAAALRYGDSTEFVEGFLPRDAWRLTGDLVITADRALIAITGLVVTTVLILVHRRTRFGLATSAVAENPRAAEVLGWSSQTISLVNWMIGAGLAGLAGILVAPVNGLSVAGLSNLVYGALAAALIGRFRSFGWAMAGGLLLGVAQSEAVRITTTVGWSTAVPFIVIVGSVLLRRDSLSVRGEVTVRLPDVGTGRIRPGVLLATIVALAAVLGIAHGNWLAALTASLTAGILALSVVVATGYAGQLSLGQYAVAGVAALVAVRAAADLGLPFPLAVLVGALAGAVLGAFTALVAIRAHRDALAIVTLGIALALQALVLENPSFTGGISGIALPAPTLLGLDVDNIAHPTRYAVVVAVVFLLLVLATANLRRSAAGRALLAVRSAEQAASTLGLGVRSTKVFALTVAGALAGTAGALEVFAQRNAVFDGFTVDASLALLVAVVLSGAGYVASGPMAGLAISGGFVYYLLAQTGWQLYLPLALGLLLLVNLVLVPDGVMKLNIESYHALRRRIRPAAPVLPPAAGPTAAGELHRVPASVLEVRDVGVAFGGVVALDAVSLSVRPGRVHGLIGPNGAGKTTFIDVVTGVTRQGAGQVLLGGATVDGAGAVQRARRGLGRTLQGLELFDELTVRENLLVASGPKNPWGRGRDVVAPPQPLLSGAALSAAARFGLEPVLDRRPPELPYGQRRLVAIARAVAAEPSVLLMDEPAAGLSTGERQQLGRLIRDLVEDAGMAVLLVEHDVDLVMRVSDEITVLEFGRVIASGEPAAVRADAEVRRAFLGEGVVQA